MANELVTKRAEFLSDVLVNAIESNAIGYWANVRNYRHNDGAVSAEVQEQSSDNGEWQPITSNTIQLGIDRILYGYGFVMNEDLRGIILDSNRNNDATDIDDDLSDCIIQASIFGKLVYG